MNEPSGRSEVRRAVFGSAGYRPGWPFSSRPVRVVVLALAALAILSLLTRLPAWKLGDLRAFDYISTIDSPEPPAGGPVIVAIDEPSLAEINAQWPWPRQLHGRLIEALRAAGARAIGLDIIMAEPSTPENDAAIAAAVGPDVVLAGDETLIKTPQADQLIRTTPMPQLTEAGARTGIASIELGGDGIFRNIPRYGDGFAAMLAVAAGLTPKALPADALIQSYGPARSYPTVSYYQALDPANFLPPGFFKDRVVLVGLSLQNAPEIDKGGADAFATPFTVHTGRLVPGVEIQATIFDNLRLGSAIDPADPLLNGACILAAVLVASLAVWRTTGWHTFGFCLLSLLFFSAVSYAGIRLTSTYVSPLGPTLGFIGLAFGQTAFDYAEERRNKRQITRAFSQYISPELVRRLSDDPSQLQLGGETRTLSILFSDVRGFTTIAETMKDDPQALTALINRLLTPLSDVVMDHGGTIDKYIGDCIMAFWNAPLDDPDHAIHAVEAAIAMQKALAELNDHLEEESKLRGRPHHVLRMGIGINTGDCVVGNMGSTRRFDYSCLGDSVNLASRLEGVSKNYGVALLLGEETARRVAGRFTTVELDRITVKGRTLPSPVFTLVKAAGADVLAEHEAFLARRYARTLSPLDPAFERLPAAMPELDGYYRIMRQQLTGDPDA
ncbi:CHASE2 domain-containing protein [Gellertiella hungarica]|uniref:Adenylate cyclase n=1 Tax=Gellertiella hungarica TaxID=1572859 RepID=A0A7W6J4Y1_9HYPH|nr:adenylate/guanylate cyclase domain-containing protein [Gellertiella hungarica]MBB4063948.1 adenylate cyclase [Gellertiella hungarica]